VFVETKLSTSQIGVIAQEAGRLFAYYVLFCMLDILLWNGDFWPSVSFPQE